MLGEGKLNSLRGEAFSHFLSHSPGMSKKIIE
jgi:hypothetical protein